MADPTESTQERNNGAKELIIEQTRARLAVKKRKAEEDAARAQQAGKHAKAEDTTFMVYHDALSALKDQPIPDDKTGARFTVDQLISKLLQQAFFLKEEGKVNPAELEAALKNTYQFLTGNLPKKDYDAIANTVTGKPSTGLKVLGGIMIALSIAVVALSIAFFPAALGIAAAVSLTGTAATATTVAAMSGTGLVLGAGGFGLFAKGKQQTGLSLAMANVADAAEATNVRYDILAGL